MDTSTFGKGSWGGGGGEGFDTLVCGFIVGFNFEEFCINMVLQNKLSCSNIIKTFFHMNALKISFQHNISIKRLFLIIHFVIHN